MCSSETILTVPKLLYVGAEEICHAVGVNPRQIVYAVTECGLPAWKNPGSTVWRALPEDLTQWLKSQKYIAQAHHRAEGRKIVSKLFETKGGPHEDR